MDHQLGNAEVFITKDEDFLQNLPSSFHIGAENKVHYDPERVNVFSAKGIFFAKCTRLHKVQNLEEFKSLKDRIFKNPIVTRVALDIYPAPFGCCMVPEQSALIMAVNTSSPKIKDQLIEKLDEAEGVLKNGGKFSLQFHFTDSLTAAIDRKFPGEVVRYDPTQCSFCVTNFNKPIAACYDCYTVTTVIGESLLLGLLCIGLYRCYRITCRDIEKSVEFEGTWGDIRSLKATPVTVPPKSASH